MKTDCPKNALTPSVHMNGSTRASMQEEWNAFLLSLQEIALPYESLHHRNHYPKTDKEFEEFLEKKEELFKLVRRLTEIGTEVCIDLNE